MKRGLVYSTLVSLVAMPGSGIALGATGATERVSVANDGTQANGSSTEPVLSADGRYVAFLSVASNLVAGDTNDRADAFVRDRQTGTTDRVSVSTSGTQTNSQIRELALSADGRFVALVTNATNLAAGNANGSFSLFVRDRQAGTTERVSLPAGLGFPSSPDLNADGRILAFSATGGLSFPDVYIYDLRAGTFEKVSVAHNGAQANAASIYPSLSADGRFVAFRSDASNIVADDTNGVPDIFVRDRLAHTTERVSVTDDGAQANGWSEWPALSADGRYVTFTSLATNLVPGDTNGATDVFVRDRLAGKTERVSVANNGDQANRFSTNPSISADGRYVAFESLATNLIAVVTNLGDIYVRDRQAHTTVRASVTATGTEANGSSNGAALSASGRYVAFTSSATNLVAGDTNGAYDIFVHDQEVPTDPVDTTPPYCGRPTVGKDAQNRTTLTVMVRDTADGVAGQGLKTVEVTHLGNATVTLSPAPTSQNPPGAVADGTTFTYAPPTTDQVTVVATKTDQALSSQLALKLTDMAGLETVCDPILLTLTSDGGRPETTVEKNVPSAEGTVTIMNGTPGLDRIIVTVNRRPFQANNLKPGEHRTIDIGAALRPRDNNVVTLTALGRKGTSADVMIWDGPDSDVRTPAGPHPERRRWTQR